MTARDGQNFMEGEGARNTVVILAPDDDLHATMVAQTIVEHFPSHKVFIVNGADFPQRATLSISDGQWHLDGPWGAVHSEEVCSVWYRRPKPPVIDDDVRDAAARKFALQECGLAFDFIALSRDYKVVNRIESHFAANRKPYQLYMAKSCGLNVPEYEITNDPRVLTRILDSLGDDAYIFKTLGAATHSMAETRLLNKRHLESQDLIKYAPVIFQKKVARKKEYRVTVIGEEIFVHEIVVNNDVVKNLPDWRLDISAQSVTSEIPTKTIEQLRALMTKLDLAYGAVDFIEDNDGGLYFLEVNPQGQFLFGEADTGEPMCLAFARLLTNQ